MAHSHFELRVQAHFSAAHHLRGYDGNCATPHGHNWLVEVYVHCDRLNDIGIGVDFKDIKAAIKSLFDELDHSDLNTLPPFETQNPSSENVAKYLYHELKRCLDNDHVRVTKVWVAETQNYGVTYWQD